MDHTNLIKNLNTLNIIKKIIAISIKLNKQNKSQIKCVNQNINAKTILKNTYKSIILLK
jgi:hypothetical protein